MSPVDGVEQHDLLPPGSEITLDNCAREPIHTPGGIQPHGALLAVVASTHEIVQRSENALERLGLNQELLGSVLDELVGDEVAGWLAARAAETDAAGLRPSTVTLGPRRFDAFSYGVGEDLVVIELEPAGPAASAAALADDVAGLLAALQAATSTQELLESAAGWAHQLTGFDRVWIYRFESDDHGVVIVEERSDELEPFLGLHFPARDIPPQARALFLQNRVRFIPDSFGSASPLVPLVNPVSNEWLDLSKGILRAVSPMHLQYLQNLGATASMSIALQVEGRLWGLISGHHYSGSRVVEHRFRLACEVLGRVVSTQLTALQAQEAARTRAITDRHREAVLSALAGAGEGQLVRGLAQAGEALLGLCGADGVAVISGEELEVIGDTPSASAIRELVRQAQAVAADDTQAGGTGLFMTESLAVDLPEQADAAMPSSGAMLLPLDRTGSAALLWFRNEYARSVTWGDSGLAPAKGRLSPTGSYATWSEAVRRTSRPWSTLDRDAVLSLRGGIGTVVLDQAERLELANRELRRSNADLEAFTWVIAHDLREPLRNIRNYLDFFFEDHGETIEPDGAEQLRTIERLSASMDAMMDSLLDQARADRLRPQLVEVTLRELVDDAVPTLGPYSARGEIEVLTPDALVLADRDAMLHILVNLLSNAMKYSPEPRPRVEIDVRPIAQTSRGDQPGMAAIGVRDFGIGVAAEYHETIFELFRRLHARDAYQGGSGAGLSIARRLAERQGGDLWLESSAPGDGTLFCISVALPADEMQMP